MLLGRRTVSGGEGEEGREMGKGGEVKRKERETDWTETEDISLIHSLTHSLSLMTTAPSLHMHPHTLTHSL